MDRLTQFKIPSFKPAPVTAATPAPVPPAAPPADTQDVVIKGTPVVKSRSLADQLPFADRTFSAQVKKQDFFGEDKTSFDSKYYFSSPAGLVKADSDFFTGQTGRFLAARFVDRSERTDGDFRYASGKDDFQAWMKADAKLTDIPKGQLADKLDPALLSDLQKTVAVPDHSLKGMFELAGQKVGLGRTPASGNLQDLLDKTTAGLKDPKSDPYQVAAGFLQGFTALHPSDEAGGRVARLVSDHILMDRGLLPPIMAGANFDLPKDPAAVAQSLKDGVARSQDFLEHGCENASNYLSNMTMNLERPWARIEGPKEVVRVGGMPFAQNNDGFVYDAGGRPYRADDQGVLQPMSQMEYYFDMRRVSMQPDPLKTLTEFTAKTRDAFSKLSAEGDQAKIGDDLPVIHADNQYAVKLQPGSHQDLVQLFDPKAVVPVAALFEGREMSQHSTFATTAMSRYDQLDLELWHMQRAMTEAGDTSGVQGMQANREALFGLAKTYLEEHPSARPQNVEKLKLENSPLRFSSFSEAIKHTDDNKITLWRGDLALSKLIGAQPDYIPLRNDAKDDAKIRDSRGGTASVVAQLQSLSGTAEGTGFMSFTSDPLLLADEDFASKTTQQVFAIKDLASPLQALVNSKLAQTGSLLEIDKPGQMLSAVLGGNRAVPAGSVEIGQDGALDGELMKKIGALKLEPAISQSVTDRIDGVRKQAADSQGFLSHSVSTVVNLSDLIKDPKQVEALQTDLASQRALVSLRRIGPDSVQAQFYRRAFVSEVDKADCIPGINALGGSFEQEQEIHVDKAQGPGTIVKEYPVSALRTEEDAPKFEPKPHGVSNFPGVSPFAAYAKEAANKAAATAALAASPAPEAPPASPPPPASTIPAPDSLVAGQQAK